jgi:hypothetical protein
LCFSEHFSEHFDFSEHFNMPTVKIPFESELYFEIKAKYEAKNSTVDELANEYGVGRPYLTMYAKKHKWERGKTQSIYEAKKLVEMDKVLNEFKKKPERIEAQVITKTAKKEGAKKAELILQSENYKLEMENKLADIGRRYLEKMLDSLNSIEGGKVVDTEIEGTVIDDNGKPSNIITKTTVLRPKEFAEITKMMQAFGILPHAPTVAIQNNQTNNQGGEAKESEAHAQLERIKTQPDFQNFVKDKLLVKQNG